MNVRPLAFALGVGVLASCTAAPRTAPAPAARAWRPAPAPLLTRWAADVSPDRVLPEYPRPQLVRPRWLSLNGLWEFAPAAAHEAPPVGRALPRRILVPFAPEAALSGIGEHHERLWYRRTFVVPRGWSGRVLLHFGAVDWRARVWVNGRDVGTHTGGYDAFSLDITDALRARGAQELVVGVYDPTDSGPQPRGKQVTHPRSIWYSPVTGIWQAVWLEPVPALHVRRLAMTPDVDAGVLRLDVGAAGARRGDSVVAVALDHGREMGRASGAPGVELRVPVPHARLWSPADPFLYDLRVSLRRGGETVDSIASYFGMRDVRLLPDSAGRPRIALNGRPTFLLGPLDQGWWPGGLYTAPTDEALRADLELTKRLGFTMTRKHVKVEPQRWYYWADRLGIVVWQDMPSGRNDTPASRGDFERELRAMIEQHRDHPSIIAWVPFNEGWGEYDAARIAGLVARIDPSRLVIDASGWHHAGAGNVLDVHRYQGPQAMRPDASHAAVVGEFGGLGMRVAGHEWTGGGWGYDGTFSSTDSLAARYQRLIGEMWRLADADGMSAGVYTQLTDVEREVNGLLTYDRAVLKMADTARVAAIDRGLVPLILPAYRAFTDSVVVTMHQGHATPVHYTLDGSAPTATSPMYRAPIVLHGDATVRALAFVNGEPVGPPARATFVRVPGRAPDTVAALIPGVEWARWESGDLRALRRAGGAAGDSTSAPARAGTARGLAIEAPARDGHFAIRYTGYIRVPRTGVYTFTATADDGVALRVGDATLIDALSYSPAPTESSGSIALRAGVHPLALGYLSLDGAPALAVRVTGPGVAGIPVDSLLFRPDSNQPRRRATRR